MCYALIGANWAIFTSINGILASFWAKWSIVLVLLALTVGVLGSWVLSELMRSQISRAESNYGGWAKEFAEAKGTSDPWPFSEGMEITGKLMRWTRSTFVLASGIFLIIGALSAH